MEIAEIIASIEDTEMLTLTQGDHISVPRRVVTFQDWVDQLSHSEFKEHLMLCNKENLSELETKEMLNLAMLIFFRENKIYSMPNVEELLVKLLGEFKRSVIRIGLVISGKLIINGPIILKREMIHNCGVKVYCI